MTRQTGLYFPVQRCTAAPAGAAAQAGRACSKLSPYPILLLLLIFFLII